MEEYKNYERIEPVHPGEILLAEFMEPNHISRHRLALDLGISPSQIYMLTNRKRPITLETAIRLSVYFHNSAQFWLNLQSAYDIEMSEITGVYKKIAGLVRPSQTKSAHL